MTINLSVPTQTTHQLQPRITVVGVGGGGCNAVNNMIEAQLQGVDFLVANTDGQSLSHSKAERKVQLGSQLTGGLGAGSKPEIGRSAAEESIDAVMAELTDCNMVFITAGMGGGTGTGAAPVIARAAREQGILTVGVVTKPFHFEGKRRMTQAEDGVKSLQEVVDTLIVIPNQNLFTRANEQTRFTDAFSMADTVLHQGVSGVTDLIIKPGLINLDFADIKSVMLEMGKAMMGTGEASGENRAREAAEAAINNPLLDHSSMHGASALLINITGGYDMTLFEVDEAANRVKQEIDEDATIVFGTAFDESMENIMRVSVVATGIEAELSKARPPQNTPIYENGTPIIMPPQPVHAPQSTNASAPVEVAAEAGFAETTPALQDQPVMHAQATLASAEQVEIAPIRETVSPTTSEVSQDDEGDASAPSAISTEESPHPELKQIDLETLARERTEQSQEAVQAMRGEEMASAEEASAPFQPLADADTAQKSEITNDEAQDTSATIFGASHNEAKVIRKPAYPFAPISKPEETAQVPATKAVPQGRPSLFNRISKAFQASQEEAVKTEPTTTTQSTPQPTQSREEPLLKREDAVLPYVEEPTIMDLPKPDVVQTTLPVEPASQQTEMDDDMDIPAFLRRQAN